MRLPRRKASFTYWSTSASPSLHKFRTRLTSSASCSAGQTGPVSRWFEDPNAPERKDADTIGRALFDGESFESWGDLYKINTFSVFFVTTAFLGLLAAGTEESPSHTSAVINVTSVSGLMKLSQNHVRALRPHAPHPLRAWRPRVVYRGC